LWKRSWQSSPLQLTIFTLIEMFRIGRKVKGDKAAGIREIIAKTESGL